MGNDSKKGIPSKAHSASRKARRIKNRARQPERKLRHILACKRGVTPPAKVREGWDWAVAHGCQGLAMDIMPDIKARLTEIGHGVEG